MAPPAAMARRSRAPTSASACGSGWSGTRPGSPVAVATSPGATTRRRRAPRRRPREPRPHADDGVRRSGPRRARAGRAAAQDEAHRPAGPAAGVRRRRRPAPAGAPWTRRSSIVTSTAALRRAPSAPAPPARSPRARPPRPPRAAAATAAADGGRRRRRRGRARPASRSPRQVVDLRQHLVGRLHHREFAS